MALAVLGLTKVAAAEFLGPDGEPLEFWDSIWANSSHAMVGKPRQYYNELRSGTAFSPGSYSRKALWPSLPLAPDAGLLARAGSKILPALTYVPSAIQLYAATQAPPEQKGSALGGAIGGLAGTALGMPLGVVGSGALGIAGAALGDRIGSMFNSDPPAAESVYAPGRT